mmetsp:Transcript_138083/g.344782  ORF Transcript_138083/g.344782 Transcript_138083/m.344782 type:complete len:219 (-) Transcript_138083:1622-2278(-)
MASALGAEAFCSSLFGRANTSIDILKSESLLGDRARRANLAGEAFPIAAAFGAMAASWFRHGDSAIFLMGEASLMSSLSETLALLVTSPRTMRPLGPVRSAGLDEVTGGGASRGVSRGPLLSTGGVGILRRGGALLVTAMPPVASGRCVGSSRLACSRGSIQGPGTPLPAASSLARVSFSFENSRCCSRTCSDNCTICCFCSFFSFCASASSLRSWST